MTLFLTGKSTKALQPEPKALDCGSLLPLSRVRSLLRRWWYSRVTGRHKQTYGGFAATKRAAGCAEKSG
ncbi:MAG: hypothetical protein ACAH88_18810, partial [Roseimicrobium sp.]